MLLQRNIDRVSGVCGGRVGHFLQVVVPVAGFLLLFNFFFRATYPLPVLWVPLVDVSPEVQVVYGGKIAPLALYFCLHLLLTILTLGLFLSI